MFLVLGDPLDSADIHLVMEYIKGDNWNQFIAPRANRFVLFLNFISHCVTFQL